MIASRQSATVISLVTITSAAIGFGLSIFVSSELAVRILFAIGVALLYLCFPAGLLRVTGILIMLGAAIGGIAGIIALNVGKGALYGIPGGACIGLTIGLWREHVGHTNTTAQLPRQLP